MPCERVRAGEEILATMRSVPGWMKSVSRPTILAVNGAGLVPDSTVKPVPVTPLTALAVGNAVGQSMGEVILLLASLVGATASAPPRARAVVAAPATRRPLRCTGVPPDAVP